jgi:hypothetical protein
MSSSDPPPEDDILPIGRTIKRIKREYDEDSEDWRVIGGNDGYGNRDMFVQHAPNTWWLKSKAITPHSNLTVCKQVRNIDDEITNRGAGFNESDAQQELHRLFGMMVPVSNEEAIVTHGIERQSPPLAEDLRQKIEERDRELPRRMRRNLDSSFRKHFPMRDNMYM